MNMLECSSRKWQFVKRGYTTLKHVLHHTEEGTLSGCIHLFDEKVLHQNSKSLGQDPFWLFTNYVMLCTEYKDLPVHNPRLSISTLKRYRGKALESWIPLADPQVEIECEAPARSEVAANRPVAQILDSDSEEVTEEILAQDL